jgi:hypothetical protein
VHPGPVRDLWAELRRKGAVRGANAVGLALLKSENRGIAGQSGGVVWSPGWWSKNRKLRILQGRGRAGIVSVILTEFPGVSALVTPFAAGPKGPKSDLFPILAFTLSATAGIPVGGHGRCDPLAGVGEDDGGQVDPAPTRGQGCRCWRHPCAGQGGPMRHALALSRETGLDGWAD